MLRSINSKWFSIAQTVKPLIRHKTHERPCGHHELSLSYQLLSHLIRVLGDKDIRENYVELRFATVFTFYFFSITSVYSSNIN